MRKLFMLFATAAMIFAGGCSKEYDDSALNGRVDNLENRVAKLEELCRQMNTNISSLQAIVTALQNKDYVTGVTPVMQNGKEIGYTVTFSKSSPITIYHGQDGKDGIDGTDGKDGLNGADGHTPIIGVRQDTDGIYYWTLDGDWLIDNSGNKVKAEGRDGQPGADGQDGQDGADGQPGADGQDGRDGITPQLKIENDYWFVSTDNGATWINLGKATGENGQDGVNGVDGQDGDSFFQGVNTTNSEYVIFTLADGTEIKLPTWYAFEQLRTLCNQMNTNISSLQTIVNALQNNDYITACTPLMEEGVQIGYTIAFAKSSSIVIYHGQNGQDGSNGADGQDGHSPVVGVKTDTDGVIYWTIDGEWLTDESGNKIPVHGRDGVNGSDGNNGVDGQPGADGQDGITPQLKIENGYWFVSSDNGATWTNLGKATGENGQDGVNGVDGQDGDSFFQGVNTTNSEYVIFTLADGTEIKLPTWYAFEQLRTLCNQMNSNISSLQTIVSALQNNDYITACTPLMEEGVQIGYTITFAKSGSIVIYHGQDGQDGVNGADGQDGHSPVVGAKTDTDGVIYWTIDGEWLTDESGNKIPVHGRGSSNGQDGIIPQLKIENDYWYVSYDNGVSWSQLGKATGENGQDGADGADGKSFFQSVTQDEDYVYLTLSTGERIDVPKHHPLSVTFSETEDIRVLADKTYTIGYTITGADENTVIKALAQDGFRAVVNKTDNATGTIEITTPSTILPTEVLVFVTDGRERTIMRSINFVEGVILISTKSYSVGYEGGTIEVPLSTNIDYTVEIPEADRSWLSVADTRAVMRDETLTFTAAANNTLTVRYTAVRLIDALGVTGETILITQRAGSAQNLHIATAGTLENIISADQKDTVEELTLTGTINTFDFDFIRTMTNLKLLDLSGLDNTTIPAGCLTNSTIPTVILPLKLTAIPNRAFYQADITSIYIPETVETIGDYAFYRCTSIQGDLVIPDATTSIGEYCFQESTFNGILKLGNGLQTINYQAFYQCANFTGDLIIPDNVTTLGEGAFKSCTGFNGKIVIGNGLQSIPIYAFCGCSGLTGTITLGENLEKIGGYAFYDCNKLTGNLIIPDKVRTIGENAFRDCEKLNGYLTIGSAVTRIVNCAFYSIHFSRIYCKPTTPPSGTGGIISSIVLYVPTGCKAAYEATSEWLNFSTIEEIEF